MVALSAGPGRRIIIEAYAMASIETELVPDLPTFGRFRATAELGAGAMGTVYAARDEVLGREVAIKTLHAGKHDAGLRERFFREARAVGAVAHPSIVAIFDMGTAEGAPYLVMELASGGSLRHRLSRGRLTVDEACGLGIQIAHALATAHARGILHRDVKPANILATRDGAWKLADFGIARLPDSELTSPGTFLGSPSYAAPESLTLGQFSPASDVYSLGATLYEALTGATPHGTHDLGALMRRIHDAPPPLRDRVQLPASVEAAIASALARDPAARPTAAELARRLAERAPLPAAAEIVMPEPVTSASAMPATAVAAGAPARHRARRWVIGALVAAAVLALIAASQRGAGTAGALGPAGLAPFGAPLHPSAASGQAGSDGDGAGYAEDDPPGDADELDPYDRDGAYVVPISDEQAEALRGWSDGGRGRGRGKAKKRR